MAYLPLSTASLPDPAIDPAQGSSPEDYFNTALYTGDNTSPRSITGVGFDPEFVWVKNRTSSYGHYLWDVVRGTDKNLRSDGTFDEAAVSAASNGIVSTNTTDGFITKAGGSGSNNVNGTGGSYVAWNWKANGSGVSNTDGSITSTVSANTQSGFSIVSYTGNGTVGATVGHGISTPDVIIIKRRDASDSWPVYHSANTSTPEGQLIKLDITGANVANGSTLNSTAPSSTVFTLGNDGRSNANTGTYIAYCFHSVEGYSKFGSYTGNGNADGSFVYTGFRPSFLIIKATGLNEGWIMYDTKRNSYNLSSTVITAEEASGDATNTVYGIDILSNGFKCRYNWNGVNGSGQNYIYMAFAENPFKYSNAR